MCRRFTVIVGLLLLAQGAFAESPIPEELPGLPADSSICFRAPAPPVIDGDLSDWVPNPKTEWIGAAFKFMGQQSDVLPDRLSYWDGPDDMSSMWAMMYDDEYLYFAAAIWDNYLQTGGIDSLAKDSTLMYFDIDGDLAVDMHFSLGVEHDAVNDVNVAHFTSMNISCISPDRVRFPDANVVYVMDERLGPAGRFVELQIPLQPLLDCGMTAPIVGRHFGINPAQEESYNTNQPDGGAFVSWLGDTLPHAVYYADPLYQDVIAYGPNPMDKAEDISRETEMLTWRAGKYAATHDIYFGTDFNAVTNATTTDPEYQESQTVDGVIGSFDLKKAIPSGLLTIGQTYYWRVDEVNDAPDFHTYKGNVFSFTVAPFLIVDDFESYDNDENPVFNTWLDGYFNPETNGAVLGHPDPDIDAGDNYMEKEHVRSTGVQSLPIYYNNEGTLISEVELPLEGGDKDLTRDGMSDLSVWFKGFPSTQGSVVENPANTFTIRGAGSDIWADADHFHFVYKELTGKVSIIAKIESLENDPGDPNTHEFAKAGIMIRNNLKAGSRYGSMLLSKGNGLRNQYRSVTNDITKRTFDPNIVTPYWVKMEREAWGMMRFFVSTDGKTWTKSTVEGTGPDGNPANEYDSQFISMSPPFYVGMAVSSRLEDTATEAVFSNVTITGGGSDGPWLNKDVGIYNCEPNPIYVAVDDAIVYYETLTNPNDPTSLIVDPNATQIETWTELRIPLQDFANQGADITNASLLKIGIGIPSDQPRHSGEGQIFIDDLRLYMP